MGLTIIMDKRATAVKSVDPKNRKEASVHSGNVKDGYVGDFF